MRPVRSEVCAKSSVSRMRCVHACGGAGYVYLLKPSERGTALFAGRLVFFENTGSSVIRIRPEGKPQ